MREKAPKAAPFLSLYQDEMKKKRIVICLRFLYNTSIAISEKDYLGLFS